MKMLSVLFIAVALFLTSITVPAFAGDGKDTAMPTASSLPPQKFKGEELAKNAKINIKQARALALKAFPGKITDEELEVENGGSGLRYSFDINKGSTVYEVGVDAQTGKVLENAKEGPNPD